MGRREVTDPALLAELRRELTQEPSVKKGGSDSIGAGESFIHGGVDAIPFGKLVTALGTSGALKLIQALSDNPAYQDMDTSVSGQLGYEKNKLAQSEAAHPYATGAGKIVGGAASSMALPSTGIGNPMAAAGVDAARYGALHGLGEGDLDTSLEDRLLRATKEGVISGALGAASYPVAQYVGQNIPKAVRYASEGAKNLAGKARFAAFHPTKEINRAAAELEGGASAIGRDLMERDIPVFSALKASSKIEKARDFTGKQIDEAINEADLWAKTRGAAPPYPPHSINKALRDVVDPMMRNAPDSAEATAGRNAENILKQWRELNKQGEPTFKRALDLKRKIGGEAYGVGQENKALKNPIKGLYGDALNKTHGILKEDITSRMSQFSPYLTNKFTSNNLASQRLGLAAKANDNLLFTPNSKYPFGVMDAAAGGLVGYGHGLDAALGAALTSKAIRKHGAQAAASALYGTGKGIEKTAQFISKLPISESEKTNLLASILRSSAQRRVESKNE